MKLWVLIGFVLALSVREIHAYYYTCGTSLSTMTTSTSSNYFSSNGYTLNRLYSANCYVFLRASSSSYRVKITFIGLRLRSPSAYGSCYDYVEVRDGRYSSSTLLGKFCGTNIPPYIISSGQYLYVKFYSTYTSTLYSGFRIKYVTETSSKYSAESTTECKPSNSFYKNNNLRLTSSYSSWSSKYIKSPNYPWSYPNSVQCTWKITASSSYRVKLTRYIRFALEYDSGCDNDYLRVRDGSSASSRLIGDYCGTKSSWTVYSTGRYMWVRFRSNHVSQYDGFYLEYTSVKITSSSGSSSAGIIAGVVVAIGIVVAIIVGVVCCMKKKGHPGAVTIPAATTVTTVTTSQAAPQGRGVTTHPPPGGSYPAGGYPAQGQPPPPYGQPSYGQPNSYPEKGGQYPPGQQPGAYPAGQQPGGYPPGQQPGGYPAGQQPGGYPPGQQPGAYPPGQQPGGYPPDQQPGAYPPGQQPGTYPPGQQPGGYPAGQPGAYPMSQYPPPAGNPTNYPGPPPPPPSDAAYPPPVDSAYPPVSIT